MRRSFSFVQRVQFKKPIAAGDKINQSRRPAGIDVFKAFEAGAELGEFGFFHFARSSWDRNNPCFNTPLKKRK